MENISSSNILYSKMKSEKVCVYEKERKIEIAGEMGKRSPNLMLSPHYWIEKYDCKL